LYFYRVKPLILLLYKRNGGLENGEKTMKWSWKLGTYAGIDVYMHATFLILIGFVALSYWAVDQSLVSVLVGVGFILALFGCVVLHEYGHALTARKFGIKTRDITLLPIGGLARLERMPDDPKQELWVALAGPAVNVVIAAVIFVWLLLTNSLSPLTQVSLTGGPFLERLMVVNLFLVGFNMLPAFPMDGGRVLRALLAMRMEYTRATQLSASLGQGMAIIFGFVGLLYNPFLLFIAFFVWIGAAQEASMVQMKSSLGGIPVSRAMITDFQELSPYHRLGDVVELVLKGYQQDFPVVDGGRVVGVLMRNDLLSALQNEGKDTPVVRVMKKEFTTVDSYEMLETAFMKMQACECHTMPVTHGGELIGLFTMDNVGEFIAIQAALRPMKGKSRSVRVYGERPDERLSR
jgi:Zn-dependent protease/predicted transcriptional regulator